jgi:DNA-binding GntR family transcriptional regulator
MLRSDVYEELKGRLFSGDLKTGQFVSQRELADLLGATLNPVREAIRKLEAEGLINVYAQRGIQIVEGGPKAINDSYDYRLLLESSAIEIFVRDATDKDIADLRGRVRSAIEALREHPNDRATRWSVLEEDFEFHKRLVDFQNNGIISRYYSLNAARIRLFRANMGEPLQRLEVAAEEHLAILSACRKRDVAEARKLLVRHIEVSREHTLGIRPMRS